MTVSDIIKSVLEIAVILFTVWGLFHEDKFIAFEDRIFARFRRKRFKVISGNFDGGYKREHHIEKIS